MRSSRRRDIIVANAQKPEPEIDYLCFTAEEANSSFVLYQTSTSAPKLNLEMSRDKQTWTTFTDYTTVYMHNVGDKIYFRGTNNCTAAYETSYNYFVIDSGLIAASGDITTILDPAGGVNSLENRTYAFTRLFIGCNKLVSAPYFPSKTTSLRCYYGVFEGCASLRSLPRIDATYLAERCCERMFYNCGAIKLSEYQTTEYKTPYRIPSNESETATAGSFWNYDILVGSSGDYKSIQPNQTYYGAW